MCVFVCVFLLRVRVRFCVSKVSHCVSRSRNCAAQFKMFHKPEVKPRGKTIHATVSHEHATNVGCRFCCAIKTCALGCWGPLLPRRRRRLRRPPPLAALTRSADRCGAARCQCCCEVVRRHVNFAMHRTQIVALLEEDPMRGPLFIRLAWHAAGTCVHAPPPPPRVASLVHLEWSRACCDFPRDMCL